MVFFCLKHHYFFGINVASYTGAASSGTEPSDTGTSNTIDGNTEISVEVTTVTDNAWVVGYYHKSNTGATWSAGSGDAVRPSSEPPSSSSLTFGDSADDVTPAGAETISAISSASTNMTVLAGAFAPFSEAPDVEEVNQSNWW